MPSQLVVIAASEIRYEGESIGRELTLDVGIVGEHLSCNLRLLPGETRQLDREIVQLWCDGDRSPVSGQIRVTERDAVYSETGASDVSWSIDLDAPAALESVYRIEVSEVGNHAHRATGVFLVTLRAQVFAGSRYIAESGTGWMTVVLDDTRAQVSLPETVHVEVSRLAEGREYFVIKEGSYRGKRASLRLNRDGSTRLGEEDPRGPPIRAAYSISRKTLAVGSTSYVTIDHPSNPWSKGVYDIEIPESPHKGGLSYPEARRSRTWFRVGHSGDRYIHTGAASAGCITVVARTQWDELCSKLIRGRKGDGISVGTLTVTA